MENKVLIVGAGVAGLSCAVYLQSSGYDVTVIESHNAPGGLSTNWSRQGYVFEGGMHWLTGSDPRLALNRVWREVGALQKNNPIINRDPIYTLLGGNGDGGKHELHLWRDMTALKQEFDAYSHEDCRITAKLCHDVKLMQNVHLVIQDIFGLKSTHPNRPPFSEFIKMAGAALCYARLKNQSYIDYVGQFQNPDIRHLLISVIGYRYNALSFIYTLASFSSGDCGYPVGGSRRMAQNIADKFALLGGKIMYNTRVNRVAVSNGKVSGVETKDGVIESSRVVVTQDTRAAIDTLFDTPLQEKWAQKMRRVVTAEQNMFVCLGIKADLCAYPAAIVLPLKVPFEAGGSAFAELRINNYSSVTGHAPEGCATLTCLLLGDCYDWWKTRKDDGTYKEEKAALAKRFIGEVEKWIPEIKDKVEVTDVATPLTYERYTGSYKGSWMSVWLPGGAPFAFPAKSKQITGLYFASERNVMPGGLPLTVNAGRIAAQTLCRADGTTFVPPSVDR